MSDEPLARRDFNRRLAASTAALPMAAVAVAHAQEQPKATEKSDEAKPPTPADHLAAVLAHDFPQNLDAARLAELRTKLQRQLARSKQLSSYPLTNADEPTTIFRAYRADETSPSRRE